MSAAYSKKIGQIPAFGDWEYVNELPITQYFECARQAGLLRCSCSGDCAATSYGVGTGGSGDLYGGVGFQKPLHHRVYAAPQTKHTRGMNKACQNSKEQLRKQVKAVIMDQPRNNNQHNPNHPSAIRNAQRSSIKNVKPVDEDLYKIPSELLANSKRKKMLGFFSRCMVPPCAA